MRTIFHEGTCGREAFYGGGREIYIWTQKGGIVVVANDYTFAAEGVIGR